MWRTRGSKVWRWRSAVLPRIVSYDGSSGVYTIIWLEWYRYQTDSRTRWYGELKYRVPYGSD